MTCSAPSDEATRKPPTRCWRQIQISRTPGTRAETRRCSSRRTRASRIWCACSSSAARARASSRPVPSGSSRTSGDIYGKIPASLEPTPTTAGRRSTSRRTLAIARPPRHCSTPEPTCSPSPGMPKPTWRSMPRPPGRAPTGARTSSAAHRARVPRRWSGVAERPHPAARGHLQRRSGTRPVSAGQRRRSIAAYGRGRDAAGHRRQARTARGRAPPGRVTAGSSRGSMDRRGGSGFEVDALRPEANTLDR